MSRKKKKSKQRPPVPSVSPVSSAPKPVTAPVPAVPERSAFPETFDSLEDKIRGEEMILDQENRKLRESREIEKKLRESEVDRRLEELRKQLGLPKK